MLKRTTIYLTEELHKELKLRAAKEGTTITNIINKSINHVAESTPKKSEDSVSTLTKQRGEMSGGDYV